MGRKNEKKRVANMDLLRIISMILIVLLHSIDHSGVLEAVSNADLGMQYYVRFTYMLTQISVNIFVMLSGYFLVSSKFKAIRLIRLWMEVVFYSLLWKLVFMITGGIPWSPVSLLSCFLPFFTGRYWFITIYVGMYLLSPFLNIAIRAMDQRTHAVLNFTLCILFSVWDSVWPSFAGMNSGGSWGLAWFIVLYFAAAWFRLYYIPTYNRVAKLGCWIGISAIIAGLYCMTGNSIVNPVIGNWYKYDSLPVYFSSLIVFACFLEIKISSEKISRIITLLAASTFGVYLIHAHANVSPWIWEMLDLPQYMEPYFVFIQLSSVLLIFCVCVAIDILRKNTVGRLEQWAGIQLLACKIEHMFEALFLRI